MTTEQPRRTMLSLLASLTLVTSCSTSQSGPDDRLETGYEDPGQELPAQETERASWGFIDTKPLPGQTVTPPEPSVKIEPAYPDALRDGAVRGEVVWRVLVDATGRVTQVEILSSDREEFTDAVFAVAMSWRFIPAAIDGTPHPSYMMQRHTFRP
ncbi:MAG: energy transducer TonB [Myxococcota bacterium]